MRILGSSLLLFWWTGVGAHSFRLGSDELSISLAPSVGCRAKHWAGLSCAEFSEQLSHSYLIS